MKTRPVIFFTAIIFLFTNCGNEKAAASETQSAGTSSTEKAEEPAPAVANSGDGIVGKWKLIVDAYDLNENQLLEDEERKKGTPNHYLLQLNSDSTCRIQDIFTGTYTIKTDRGKKVLVVQRKRVEGEETEDPLPERFYIKSVTSDEMVLLVIDGGSTTTFWIFKREKNLKS
jgi:hypothetical protein